MDCLCEKNVKFVNKKIERLSNHLSLILLKSPQYSYEISQWLDDVFSTVERFESHLTRWEDIGCLDLQCVSCKYTSNKENNNAEARKRLSDLQPCIIDSDELD